VSRPFGAVSEPSKRWFSKCEVQATVIEYLLQAGWQLRRVGDCAARDQLKAAQLNYTGEPMHELDAEHNGVRLIAEVTGHPGSLEGAWDEQTPLTAGPGTQRRGRASEPDPLFRTGWLT